VYFTQKHYPFIVEKIDNLTRFEISNLEFETRGFAVFELLFDLKFEILYWIYHFQIQSLFKIDNPKFEIIWLLLEFKSKILKSHHPLFQLFCFSIYYFLIPILLELSFIIDNIKTI
jgi:hypothetical protein